MNQRQQHAAGGGELQPSHRQVQVIDSAHQILTMIGANPRAIRPILTQRRLTKDEVIAAAEAVIGRIPPANGAASPEDGPPPEPPADPRQRYLIALRERAEQVRDAYQAV